MSMLHPVIKIGFASTVISHLTICLFHHEMEEVELVSASNQIMCGILYGIVGILI